VDDLDRQIIIRLAKDSRESFRKIAKELKVSTDTISERYKKMVDAGKIKACIKINLFKLGYRVHAWYWISSKKEASIMEDELLSIPNVVAVHKAIGGNYDLLVVGAVRDFEELHEMDKQVSKLEGGSILNSAHYALKGKIVEFPISPLQFISKEPLLTY
jgi:DNA-binding Lrp family transcriptional regulator